MCGYGISAALFFSPANRGYMGYRYRGPLTGAPPYTYTHTPYPGQVFLYLNPYHSIPHTSQYPDLRFAEKNANRCVFLSTQSRHHFTRPFTHSVPALAQPCEVSIRIRLSFDNGLERQPLVIRPEMETVGDPGHPDGTLGLTQRTDGVVSPSLAPGIGLHVDVFPTFPGSTLHTLRNLQPPWNPGRSRHRGGLVMIPACAWAS